MFEIYGCWELDYGVMDTRWLYARREWRAELGMSEGEGVVIGHRNGNTNGDSSNVMDIDGSDTKESPNDPSSSTSRSFSNIKFSKSPYCGPIPAGKAYPSINFGGASPLQAPTFAVLLADQQLNVYFSTQDPAVPYVNGTGQMGLQMNLDGGGFGYPRLDVLRCPLSTTSTSTLNQNQPSALGQMGSAEPQKRKRRLIRPGQGSIGIRGSDETVWVGFRSHRVRGEASAPAIAETGPAVGDVPLDIPLMVPVAGGIAGNVMGVAMGNAVAENSGVGDAGDVGDLLDDGQEEDWVEVVEVKFDCLAQVPCTSTLAQK